VTKPQQLYMKQAIAEALHSKELGDYAIGAVMVHNDTVIAGSGNRTHIDKDPTHHAEMVVMRHAASILGRKHLNGCVLYVTHEPCPMCASAAVYARVKAIVFGARMDDMTEYAQKFGNDTWKWRTIRIPAENVMQLTDNQVELVKDFMREECIKLFHS